jgi:hypothetical protein
MSSGSVSHEWTAPKLLYWAHAQNRRDSRQVHPPLDPGVEQLRLLPYLLAPS